MLSQRDLLREAAASGFQIQVLEKVLRLMELLEGLRSHPFSGSRLALKGGTALNLFVFDLPRLSVDIDLNYTGSAERQVMLEERPKVAQALAAVAARAGMAIQRVPEEHAGGKWRLSYQSVTGRPGVLEVDVNFLLRTPLWPVTPLNSRRVGAFRVEGIPVLDLHELAAGKLGALFGREASRDLFDVRELFATTDLEREKLRLAFVVYGAFNRRDWRTVRLDDVRVTPEEVDRRLVPLLRGTVAPSPADLGPWTERLVAECREHLSDLLPLKAEELEFLDRLNDWP